MKFEAPRKLANRALSVDGSTKFNRALSGTTSLRGGLRNNAGRFTCLEISKSDPPHLGHPLFYLIFTYLVRL